MPKHNKPTAEGESPTKKRRTEGTERTERTERKDIVLITVHDEENVQQYFIPIDDISTEHKEDLKYLASMNKNDLMTPVAEQRAFFRIFGVPVFYSGSEFAEDIPEGGWLGNEYENEEALSTDHNIVASYIGSIYC